MKYKLRRKNLLQTPNAKINAIEANSLTSRGAHLWNTLPNDIKMLTQQRYFKERLKNGMGVK